MEWAGFFETSDAGFTRVPLEVRHPLMDLRVSRFLVRLPTLPWCADKELLRVAMRGDLPEKILRRPKSPLAGDPRVSLLRRQKHEWLNNFASAADLRNFVLQDHVPRLFGEKIPLQPNIHLRPLSLNLWLRRQ